MLTFGSITVFHYISVSVFSILLLLALSSFLEDVHHSASLHQLSKSLTLSPELQLSYFTVSFVGREGKKKKKRKASKQLNAWIAGDFCFIYVLYSAIVNDRVCLGHDRGQRCKCYSWKGAIVVLLPIFYH